MGMGMVKEGKEVVIVLIIISLAIVILKIVLNNYAQLRIIQIVSKIMIKLWPLLYRNLIKLKNIEYNVNN